MKKQLLSILLCLIMVVGLLPTAVLAEETAPTFDLTKDLEDITIPDDLVTCICTKTGERKSYGKLPNGFSDTVVKKEYGVWTVIISVKNETYLKQFNQDMDCEHDPDLKYPTEIINQIQFKLKYEGGKWELLGEMPQNKTRYFTCSGGHVYQGDIPVIKLVTRTYTDIKVTENNKWEYSKDNGETWQGSCHFTNLQPGTEYTIIARVKATATHQPSANSAPLKISTIGSAITEEDLAEIDIPANLVTVKCKTTGDSKAYGKIPGGFTLGKPYMEGGVLKAIIYLNLPAYKDKYDADTKKTHENAEGEGNPHAAFTLKYVKNKWELDGSFPNVIILVKCDGQHPQTPPYPTEENVSGLERVQVRVQCSTDRTQFKNYGILPGSVSIMPDANDPSQATLTLIPSVYSKQYSTDTGITHIVDPNQTADNLKIQMRYDPAVGKWMPAGELTPLEVLVQCNNHQGQRYTITFKGNGGTPSVTSMTTIDQKLPELPTATRSGSYSFNGWYTEKNGGTKISMATVFDKDTTVYAHWTYTGFTGSGGVTTYPITVLNAKNGTVAASHKTAPKGATITLTVAPDKDFVMDGLAVVDGAGAAIKLTDMGNGKYTFIMPASKVTVEGSFKEEFPDFPNPFSDIAPSDFCCDAVMWAVAKDITNGIGNYTFAPNQPCTRAQIVTFLWRAAGSPAPKSASNFTDVPADAYYAKAVAWAVENGITGGTGDGKFSPDATCTRAQAVTFLYRASGSPAVSGNAAFTDVAADAYYAAAVTWAEKNGITGGIGGGLFGSDQSCTRGQIVTFLYRARNK